MTRRWARRALGASIVDPARLRLPGAPVAAFRDHRWPLDALGNECTIPLVFEQEHRRKADSMGWRDVEHAWRAPLKRLAWLMINTPVPEQLLFLPGGNYRSRPGTGTIVFTLGGVIRFLRRLHTDTGVTEIRQITPHHLEGWVNTSTPSTCGTRPP
ncbi:hypothetical protein [Saccharothrix sp. NRRL B-16348]|uniref:hypothetical protein n=1 Tax=Saccharothrix sp. NRRL B-16348 TaxID=1415542 RepID=UPI0012F7E047|nr:hypothetical protein [Saccharothrix sp. NRRL B-16348]